MEQDDLDILLRQMEEDARRSDDQYEAWRISVGLSKAAPNAVPRKNHPPAAQRSPRPAAKEVPAADPRDWQVYGLRRKYCARPQDPRLETAAPPVIKNWQEGDLAEMSAGRLQMLVRSELIKRKNTPQSQQAALLLCRRQRLEPCRRFFLYGYAAVQKTLSPQKLEELCTALAPAEQGRQPDQYGLYAVYAMARYIANVTAYTQRMQEQGYRNRQELLEQAQQAAQQKLEQARQDLNRW